MPFTFAHPAIVIPLKKGWPSWLDSTALILGSMAPDFEYFIRFKAQAVVGHTLSGFLLFNLPLVFLVALLWHYMIKKPLIYSLPSTTQKYMTPFLFDKWNINSLRSLIVFIISGMIGMGSHVFWDAFTHTNAYFVRRIPFLSNHFLVFHRELPIYKALQHGSTLVGFLIIGFYLYLRSRNPIRILSKPNTGKQIVYWASVLAIAIGVIMIRIFCTMEGIEVAYFGIYIVSSISGVIIGILSISCIFSVFKIYEFKVN